MEVTLVVLSARAWVVAIFAAAATVAWVVPGAHGLPHMASGARLRRTDVVRMLPSGNGFCADGVSDPGSKHVPAYWSNKDTLFPTEACRAYCESEPACQGYGTYSVSQGMVNGCWLYGDTQDPLRQPATSSGIGTWVWRAGQAVVLDTATGGSLYSCFLKRVCSAADTGSLDCRSYIPSVHATTTGVPTIPVAASWNFDHLCGTGTAPCSTKLVKTQCGGKAMNSLVFGNWVAAKAACLANGDRCLGVYDSGCDGKARITLCDSTKVSLATLVSSATSCVFVKPAGLQPPPHNAWRFDQDCAPGPQPCATKMAFTQCAGETLGGLLYTSWADAKAACITRGNACLGVFDSSCTGTGTSRISLCNSSSVTLTTLAVSASGGCVFLKPAGMDFPAPSTARATTTSADFFGPQRVGQLSANKTTGAPSRVPTASPMGTSAAKVSTPVGIPATTAAPTSASTTASASGVNLPVPSTIRTPTAFPTATTNSSGGLTASQENTGEDSGDAAMAVTIATLVAATFLLLCVALGLLAYKRRQSGGTGHTAQNKPAQGPGIQAVTNAAYSPDTVSSTAGDNQVDAYVARLDTTGTSTASALPCQGLVYLSVPLFCQPVAPDGPSEHGTASTNVSTAPGTGRGVARLSTARPSLRLKGPSGGGRGVSVCDDAQHSDQFAAFTVRPSSKARFGCPSMIIKDGDRGVSVCDNGWMAKVLDEALHHEGDGGNEGDDHDRVHTVAEVPEVVAVPKVAVQEAANRHTHATPALVSLIPVQSQASNSNAAPGRTPQSPVASGQTVTANEATPAVPSTATPLKAKPKRRHRRHVASQIFGQNRPDLSHLTKALGPDVTL